MIKTFTILLTLHVFGCVHSLTANLADIYVHSAINADAATLLVNKTGKPGDAVIGVLDGVFFACWTDATKHTQCKPWHSPTARGVRLGQTTCRWLPRLPFQTPTRLRRHLVATASRRFRCSRIVTTSPTSARGSR